MASVSVTSRLYQECQTREKLFSVTNTSNNNIVCTTILVGRYQNVKPLWTLLHQEMTLSGDNCNLRLQPTAINIPTIHLKQATMSCPSCHRCKKRFYVIYSGHVFQNFVQRFLFLKTFIENTI